MAAGGQEGRDSAKEDESEEEDTPATTEVLALCPTERGPGSAQAKSTAAMRSAPLEERCGRV